MIPTTPAEFGHAVNGAQAAEKSPYIATIPIGDYGSEPGAVFPVTPNSTLIDMRFGTFSSRADLDRLAPGSRVGIRTLAIPIRARHICCGREDTRCHRSLSHQQPARVYSNQYAALQSFLVAHLLPKSLLNFRKFPKSRQLFAPLILFFSIAYDWSVSCSTPACTQRPNSMFKIQRSANGKVIVFTLSGRIKAARIDELQKLLESEAHDRGLVLDLREVKLVDREAVVFLASCEAKGIKIANCPAYIREWIEQEAAQKTVLKASKGL